MERKCRKRNEENKHRPRRKKRNGVMKYNQWRRNVVSAKEIEEEEKKKAEKLAKESWRNENIINI
jgi:hypothetical protein